MLTRLWSFITGYVSLVVEGRSLEKLINMAVSRGLYLWDVKWVAPGRASVKIRLNSFRALRHIARRTSSRFKITGRGGLPFGVARVKKRKILVAGAVLSVLIVYMMSSFIWFVEVRGNKKIPTDKIVSVAEDAGLAMGTLKIGLNNDKIEKYIRNRVPELAWVGVKITGTRAVIEIAEKVILPPVDNAPANLVAEKDGMVEQLLVLNGKAAVNEGDTVKTGDILISGVIRPDSKPEEQQGNAENILPPEPVKIVRAKGIVKAKVWYEGYGEARLVDTGTKRTGKKAEVFSLRLFGLELILRGPKAPPFGDFVTSVQVKKLPGWRNIRIPVELVTTYYYEVRKYRDIIGVSEAKRLAAEKAMAGAKAKVPTDAKISREMSEEILARGSGIIRVKAVIEAVEEIGRTEPLKADELRQLQFENYNPGGQRPVDN